MIDTKKLNWLPKKYLPVADYDILIADNSSFGKKKIGLNLGGYYDDYISIKLFSNINESKGENIEQCVYHVRANEQIIANSNLYHVDWLGFNAVNAFLEFVRKYVMIGQSIRLVQFYNYSANNPVHEITKTIEISLDEFTTSLDASSKLYERYFQNLFAEKNEATLVEYVFTNK